MNKFNEWVKLRELYGMEDESTEALHEGLYSIRESLKNMLATAHMQAYDWSTVMQKCSQLFKQFPQYKDKFSMIYQNIENMAHSFRDYAMYLNQSGGRYNASDPHMKQMYEMSHQKASRFFTMIQSTIGTMMRM